MRRTVERFRDRIRANPMCKPDVFVNISLARFEFAPRELEIGVELSHETVGAEFRMRVAKLLRVAVAGGHVQPQMGHDEMHGDMAQHADATHTRQIGPVLLQLARQPECPAWALVLVAILLGQAAQSRGIQSKQPNDALMEVTRT